MHLLVQVRSLLKQWSELVGILLATGGATGDLLNPEAEEQEDRAYTDERISDTILPKKPSKTPSAHGRSFGRRCVGDAIKLVVRHEAKCHFNAR